MSNFTAIIYRQNENLDKLLEPLEESVDFFYRFYGTTPSEIKAALELMGDMFWQCIDQSRRESITLIMDLTCATALSSLGEFDDVVVLRQSETVHEEYVESIVRRLTEKGEKTVAIIEKSLADHCEIGEENPYKLTREEYSKGGWYYDKCKKIWTEAFEKHGIEFLFIPDTQDLSEFNCPIVADTHSRAHRLNEGRCICAYAKIKEKNYQSLKEIISHCRAIGKSVKQRLS